MPVETILGPVVKVAAVIEGGCPGRIIFLAVVQHAWGQLQVIESSTATASYWFPSFASQDSFQ